MLGSLVIVIGTIIGIFKCRQGESACNEWNTEGLDNLTNVILIHDIIAGIWVFRCVLWKLLIPLWKYLEITCPVYEGELVKILHIHTLSALKCHKTVFNIVTSEKFKKYLILLPVFYTILPDYVNFEKNRHKKSILTNIIV